MLKNAFAAVGLVCGRTCQ